MRQQLLFTFLFLGLAGNYSNLAQTKEVLASGKIPDKKGKAVLGLSGLVKGNLTGTVTNGNGAYSALVITI